MSDVGVVCVILVNVAGKGEEKKMMVGVNNSQRQNYNCSQISESLMATKSKRFFYGVDGKLLPYTLYRA